MENCNSTQSSRSSVQANADLTDEVDENSLTTVPSGSRVELTVATPPRHELSIDPTACDVQNLARIGDSRADESNSERRSLSTNTHVSSLPLIDGNGKQVSVLTDELLGDVGLNDSIPQMDENGVSSTQRRDALPLDRSKLSIPLINLLSSSGSEAESGTNYSSVVDSAEQVDSLEQPHASYYLDDTTYASIFCPPLSFNSHYDSLEAYVTAQLSKPNSDRQTSYILRPGEYETAAPGAAMKCDDREFLQGELLEFAVLVRSTQREDGGTGQQWVDEYRDWTITADVVVGSSPHFAQSKSEPAYRHTRALSGQLSDCHSSPALCQKDSHEVTVLTRFLKAPNRPQIEALLHIIKLPLTVREQHLAQPLILEVSFIPPVVPQRCDTTIGAVRKRYELPVSCWNTLHGSYLLSTYMMRQKMGAPTASLAAIPWSSSLTGGFGVDPEDTSAGASATRYASVRGDQTTSSYNVQFVQPDTCFPESSLSVNTEMLCHAVAGPAYQDLEEEQKPRLAIKKVAFGTPIIVNRGLVICTKLVGAMLHVELENATGTVEIEVEDIHIRGIESYCQGEIPVKLRHGEQHGILLHLDEKGLAVTTKRWQSGGCSSATPMKCSTDSDRQDRGQDCPCLVTVIVRWRIVGSPGPSIWSLFANEYDLPTRLPLEIAISCPPRCHIGTTVTVGITISNMESDPVDLVALLPKDLHYHRPSTSFIPVVESPPIVPLCARKEFGKMIQGATRIVHIQFLAVRQGLHVLPPIMLLDRSHNRRFLLRGGHIVVS